MQTLTTSNGHTVRYYTDLDEFPANRRSYLTRYQIEAAEIDCTPAALAERIQSIMLAYREGRSQDGETALQNLYFSLQSAASHYAPDALSFGCLLHDVDGVAVSDLSPEGLTPLLARLAMPVAELNQIVETVKKNSSSPETSISLGLPVRMS